MKKAELKALYEKRNIPMSEFDKIVDILGRFEIQLSKHSPVKSIDEASIPDLDNFIASLVEWGENTFPVIIGLMRYFRIIGRNDLYVQLTKYTGGDEVIENILISLEKKAGKPIVDAVMKDLDIPILGTAPKDYPKFTDRFMKRMHEHCPSSCFSEVMSGNNHGIPDQAFADEKALYEAAPSLAAYLQDFNNRQIAILQKHADTKTIWFEQEINQKVVDYVKTNQEIMSAVLKDDKLYSTKIPYDPQRFLDETNPVMRRYYACHCPFVRESVISNDPKVSADWCLCSGGFGKAMYEVILNHKLKVKCLNNVLSGDEFCRFEIDLTNIPYKK
ncbi:MAG: hypothetical protein WC479_04685 [Candidatus Izemoplasmatales bacterium]|jgi:hypothetical protein